MKIELKSVKHSEFASQETNCYEAALYVDGRKIGTVGNAGHGGPDHFYGDQTAYRAADEWCKANLPRMEYDGRDLGPTDLEGHCGELLTEWLIARDLRKALNSRVLYRRNGSVYELRWKGVRKITPRHIEAAKAKAPAEDILNLMPFEQALEVYRT